MLTWIGLDFVVGYCEVEKVRKLVDFDWVLHRHNRQDQVVREYKESNADVDVMVV
jgi:hypothetical protein